MSSSEFEQIDLLKINQVKSVHVARVALSDVFDPELSLDVVSLGLVYDVHHEGQTLVVDMTLTTPGCPASRSIPAMARAAIADALDKVDEMIVTPRPLRNSDSADGDRKIVPMPEVSLTVERGAA
ncbi:MAG: metal-sulfur cluster assembly factor [Acidimicrobiales bacterium]